LANFGYKDNEGKYLLFFAQRFSKHTYYVGFEMQSEKPYLTPKAILVILVLSIAVAVIPWITMRHADARLTENPPNNGIVAFELARTAENAQRMIDGWGPELSILARNSIRIDFIFIPAYASLFFSVTMLMSLLLGGAPSFWIRRAAFLPFVSGLADVVENVFLLLILKAPHNIPELYPRVAAWCATVKFGLLALVVVVWFTVVPIWLIQRRRKKAGGAAS
jgi:hypothetical protein